MEINSKKLDELYKEWSGEHHTTNSNKPVHDSAECCDFAEYCLKYGMSESQKADTKSSVFHLQRVSGWLDFQSNKELFNEEAKKNCLCKFECGTVIRYDEDHPMEVMTHFKLACY